MDSRLIITDVQKALSVLEAIAQASELVPVPQVAVAGVTVAKLAAVAEGLLSGAGDAITYADNLKALAASTTEPTPEQWAALDAKTDADVSELLDSTK